VAKRRLFNELKTGVEAMPKHREGEITVPTTTVDSKEYKEARERALEQLRKGFDLNFKPARSRHELHERRPVRRGR
jgi:hypothetical protein